MFDQPLQQKIGLGPQRTPKRRERHFFRVGKRRPHIQHDVNVARGGHLGELWQEVAGRFTQHPFREVSLYCLARHAFAHRQSNTHLRRAGLAIIGCDARRKTYPAQ